MADINCDMGESFSIYSAGNDEDIMPLIDIANVACGFHASDPNHMRKTVELAKKNNAAVICEIMNEDGSMAKGEQLHLFAKKHKLKIGKIDDLIAYRLKKEKLIRLKKSSNIIVKNRKFKIKIFIHKTKESTALASSFSRLHLKAYTSIKSPTP